MALEVGRTDCTMEEVKEALSSLGPKDLLLDVRTPEEYADGHIAGSRNIDHEEVAHYAGELKGFDRVIVYCRSGKRSQVACADGVEEPRLRLRRGDDDLDGAWVPGAYDRLSE